jgi:hypothetical protein
MRIQIAEPPTQNVTKGIDPRYQYVCNISAAHLRGRVSTFAVSTPEHRKGRRGGAEQWLQKLASYTELATVLISIEKRRWGVGGGGRC